VHYKGSGDCLLLISIYVGIIVSSKSLKIIEEFGRYISRRFDVVDLRDISYCLGMQFTRENDSFSIKQTGYIRDILGRFEMADLKPISTSLETVSENTRKQPKEAISPKRSPSLTRNLLEH